jgi:2-aminoethylphosphonate-pyruvate transaminase
MPELYDFLAASNLVIYPGKKTKAPTFRIGSIGELSLEDMENLMVKMKEYLHKFKIPIPVPND